MKARSSTSRSLSATPPGGVLTTLGHRNPLIVSLCPMLIGLDAHLTLTIPRSDSTFVFHLALSPDESTVQNMDGTIRITSVLSGRVNEGTAPYMLTRMECTLAPLCVVDSADALVPFSMWPRPP